MKIQLFYSGATDVTGALLAEKLKAKGGTTFPKEEVDILISWGAKTDKDIATKIKHVLNHPNNIRKNRNKLEALKLMQNAKVSVGKFVSAQDTITHIKNGTLKLPVIGRTTHHQGGNNFWTCLSNHHVETAINQGADYFQEYLPIVKEYRLHVFKEEVLHAVVKTQSDNPQKAFVDDHAEKIMNNAKNKGEKIDEVSVRYALGNIAKKNQHANQIVKSHAEGWKFKTIDNTATTVLKKLSDMSIAAVKAVGLDFGAVDCGVAENGDVFVLEVNSGPSLEGVSLDKWVAKFENYIKTIEKPQVIPAKPIAKEINKETTAIMGSKKKDAILKTELLRDLLLNASDDEAGVILVAAAKMFAGS